MSIVWNCYKLGVVGNCWQVLELSGLSGGLSRAVGKFRGLLVTVGKSRAFLDSVWDCLEVL